MNRFDKMNYTDKIKSRVYFYWPSDLPEQTALKKQGASERTDPARIR